MSVQTHGDIPDVLRHIIKNLSERLLGPGPSIPKQYLRFTREREEINGIDGMQESFVVSRMH